MPSSAGRHATVARFAFLLAVSAGVTAPAEVESVRGLYDSNRVRFEVTFVSPCPLFRPVPFAASTGWEFQLFIDADDDPTTGYGLGFDLLIRGVELAGPGNPPGLPDSPNSGHVYMRTTESDAGPGGWGRTIATVPFGMADEQHLTFDVPVGVGNLTDGYFRYAFESYYEARLVDAVYNGWTENSGDDPLDPPVCLVSTTEWQSRTFNPGNDAFSAGFHAIPNDDYMSGSMALSRGQATTISDLPILVGFDPTGQIKACNADSFTADKAVSYSAGTAYHFRVDVNMVWRTYSVTVTPESSTPVTLAVHYAFCIEQGGVGDLDNWALQASSGSQQVCSFVATECLADADDDGVVDCYDWCPNDPTRTTAGACGCGVNAIDLNGDGVADTSAGDANSDGTVDLYDFTALLDCFSGPNTMPTPTTMASATMCLDLFDFDGDGDVDAGDFPRWLLCLTGP